MKFICTLHHKALCVPGFPIRAEGGIQCVPVWSCMPHNSYFNDSAKAQKAIKACSWNGMHIVFLYRQITWTLQSAWFRHVTYHTHPLFLSPFHLFAYYSHSQIWNTYNYLDLCKMFWMLFCHNGQKASPLLSDLKPAPDIPGLLWQLTIIAQQTQTHTLLMQSNPYS